MTPPRVSTEELLALADGRREQVRAFLAWASEEEAAWSLRMQSRPDIERAQEALKMFPEPWWAVVVYSCFDSLIGTEEVKADFQGPLDPAHAEAELARIFPPGSAPPGSVGGHRKMPGVKGAKQALVSACAEAPLFREVLHGGGTFEDRYARLRSAWVRQWGRTTVFDLLLRAGALGVGHHRYEPEYAHLDGSTGPKKGFWKVWGKEIGPENAAWGEAVLRAWTEEWDAVARRVGADWDGDPYTPADFENALCIWQERRFDDFVPSRSAASEASDGPPLSRC